jgi:hypothetical protein
MMASNLYLFFILECYTMKLIWQENKVALFDYFISKMKVIHFFN